ncbi:MAG: hypothetical protein ACXWC6_02260 [Ramlibacter sp.]
MTAMQARDADVASPTALVQALYEVISGDAGAARDWPRFQSLFHPGARLVGTRLDPTTGRVEARPMTPGDYIAANQPLFDRMGFHESQIASRTERFGAIAHVFSSYASRHSPQDPEPFERGINSIQLLQAGGRWWILSLAWCRESPGSPLPDPDGMPAPTTE